MTFDEYLITFQSILVGFVATEFLTAWREQLKRWQRTDLLDLGWSALVFVLLIQSWWGAWIDRTHITDSFLTFGLSLFAPLGFSLTTALVFPQDNEDANRANIRRIRFFWFLAGLIVLLGGVDLATTLLTAKTIDRTPHVIRGLAVVLLFIAALWSTLATPTTPFLAWLHAHVRKVHGIALAASVCLLLWFILGVEHRYRPLTVEQPSQAQQNTPAIQPSLPPSPPALWNDPNIAVGLLAASLALLTLYVTYRQYVTDRNKVRLDLYERRYQVYRGVMDLLIAVDESNGNVPQPELLVFYGKTDQKRFLFAKDLQDHITMVREKVVRLRQCQRVLSDEHTLEPQREQAITETGELEQWLDQQVEGEIALRFQPYLEFHHNL